MRARFVLLMALLLTLPGLAQEQLSARLTVYNPGDGPVRLILRVENLTGQKVTVSQSTGQTHEFVITRNGEVVWTWSHLRYFLQSTGAVVFAPGEIKAFDAEWEGLMDNGKPAPKGHYMVEGYLLNSQGEPIRAESRQLVLTD
ncbi:MAG: hypothetical protein KC910_01295 [Candidatus Eremiobacteraeota bacterium]|nr:hypothetical protein [Candidatus Eremiobacteraeota bacterium]